MMAQIKQAAEVLKTTAATLSLEAPVSLVACVRNEGVKAGFGFQIQADMHDRDAERFAVLQAQFAKHGRILHHSESVDRLGPVSYLAERWGMTRHLPTLGDAEQFLVQVAGAGHEL